MTNHRSSSLCAATWLARGSVAADREGTPEVADIGMMQSKSLTYTFDGSGPYAYACHADGHYEAGMRGTITIVG